MSSISNIRLIFTGGTEEEQRSLIDAIYLVLIEHGVNVAGIKEWEGDEEPNLP